MKQLFVAAFVFVTVVISFYSAGCGGCQSGPTACTSPSVTANNSVVAAGGALSSPQKETPAPHVPETTTKPSAR